LASTVLWSILISIGAPEPPQHRGSGQPADIRRHRHRAAGHALWTAPSRRGVSPSTLVGESTRRKFAVTDDPLVRLPDQIRLNLREVAMLIFALDMAEDEAGDNGAAQSQIAAARRLLTSKLWPELGDLLEDRNEE